VSLRPHNASHAAHRHGIAHKRMKLLLTASIKDDTDGTADALGTSAFSGARWARQSLLVLLSTRGHRDSLGARESAPSMSIIKAPLLAA
jgi:hypothetical protein